MAEQRDFPYIWATWLPRLMTGDRSCEWAIWFKVHYQTWERTPSNFDTTEWHVRHTALLNAQREFWEGRSDKVYVEHQNSFRLRGETAILAGRPDLVADDDRRIDIIDVKTGQPQEWHRAQMMIYMYALRRFLEIPIGRGKVAGEIVYPDKSVKVGPGAVHGGFVQEMAALIRRLASDEPARRVPSAQECRFCDISSADCPARIEVEQGGQEMTTNDF